MIDPFNVPDQDNTDQGNGVPLMVLLKSTQMFNEKRDFARHTLAALRQVVNTRGEGMAFAEVMHAMTDHLSVMDTLTLTAAMVVIAAGGNDAGPLDEQEVAKIVAGLSHLD